MTFEAWGEVPAGMPVHHHCVVSVEHSHDSKRWVDASTAKPDLVAWQYPDAVEWMREQLLAHRDSAEGDHLERIEESLNRYQPPRADRDDHYAPETRAGLRLPGIWERLPHELQAGGWVIEPYFLGERRILAMQIICFADRGQPAGLHKPGRPPYTVCPTCARPADKPYLGLNKVQTAHRDKYAHLAPEPTG